MKHITVFIALFGSIVLNPLRAQMHVDSTGEVGIGTTDPNTKLHVTNGSSGPLSGYYSSLIRAESNGNTGLVLTTPQASSAYLYHSTPNDGGSAGIKFDGNARYMSFFTVNGTERMRLTNIGALGIGTASPTATVHIRKGTSSAGGGYYANDLRVENSSNTGILMSTPTAASAYINHATTLDGGSAGIKFDGTGRYMSFFTVNGTERMRINNVGDIGIGTTSPSSKLHVIGSVRATSFISNTTTYADFVFDEDYALPSLDSVEAHIKERGHLPGIPSEAEAMANGIDLADMQVRLLQKIEELTLHQIAQEKRLRALEAENEAMRARLR